mgnify:CR=1 FL=1|tara:strand:- start:316 stop:507 length:192 start_codon:yes stop_codon:yes gene_type:complete
MRFTVINIETFRGVLPVGEDLVVYERGEDPCDGLVLYGFDEVGLYDGEFTHPEYCFIAEGRIE